MGFNFNPLTGQLDLTSGGSSSLSPGTTPVVGGTPGSIFINDSNYLGELGPLADKEIIVGTGANPAILDTNAVGDILIDDTTGATIKSGVIFNSNINATAGIDATKIATGIVDNSEFSYLNGVTGSIQTQLNSKIPSAEKGANNGVATLDAGGKIPSSQLPNSVMEFQGTWDASTNTPTLIDGTGNTGDVYWVNIAGVQDLGSGSQTFVLGDFVIYTAANIWERSINSNAVVSVNGQIGVVSLAANDVSAADKQLSNLTGTTAFPVDLIPDSDNTKNLGSVVNRLANIYTVYATIEDIKDPGTNISAIELNNLRNLNDINGDLALDFDSREAYDQTGNPAIGWNSRLLTDTIGTTSADWDLRFLANTSGTTVLDWSGIDVSVNTRKITDVSNPTAAQDVATKDYVDSAVWPTGDIKTDSFSLSNNQVSPANITGFAFANASVRAFKALVSVTIDATTDLYESFDINGVQKGSSWDISVSSLGDSSGITFSITNAGQIQYTSTNNAGFVSGIIKFRAQALPV